MTTEQAWQVTNDAAEVYERDFVPALFGPWAPPLADVARLALGERVLDVGGGTGVLAREAARRVGPTGARGRARSECGHAGSWRAFRAGDRLATR